MRWAYLVACVLLVAGCTKGVSPLVGRWVADDGAERMELMEDGGLTADRGIPLSGTWKELPEHRIRCTVGIFGAVSPYKLEGATLTMDCPHGRVVYRRLKSGEAWPERKEGSGMHNDL